MARKSKGAPGGEKKIQFANLKRIWTDMSQQDWMHCAAELKPESRFYQQNRHIRGVCPFHNDEGPSFYITPSQEMAKCFGCGRTFFDPVQLVAAMKGDCSYAEAILYMKKRFGLKASVPDALYEKLRAYEVHQTTKALLARIFCAELLTGIAAFDRNEAEHSWMRPSLEFLMNRGLGQSAPGEIISIADEEESKSHPNDPFGVWYAITESLLLGVLPPVAIVENRLAGNTEVYNFYRRYFGQYVENFSFLGHMVFMLNDEPGSVCRFKLRAPTKEKSMVFVDDAYAADMGDFRGFFGLNYYRTFLGGDSIDTNYADTAVVVEGEFDALSSIAQQIRRQGEDYIALSLGGSSVQSLDRLANFGIRKIRVIGDDDKGGENMAAAVLERTAHEKLSLTVFNWPDEYKQWFNPANPDDRTHDPDEAVKHLGYPKWRKYVCDVQSYQQPHEWCFERASVEVSRIDEADVKQRFRVASQWGKLLHHQAEIDRYAEVFEKHFGLSRPLLSREIANQDEDEEVFIDRLATAFTEDFHIIGGQRGENRKKLLHVYKKATRETSIIILNDEKSLETEIANHFGPIYDYVRDRVGDPAWMAGENEDSKMAVSMRAKRYREYLNFALLKLSQGKPSLEHAPTRAQGLHYEGVENSEHRSYLVNGRDVYKIMHQSDGTMNTSMLEGPSDNGIIFDNTGPAWLSSVRGLTDLADPKISLPDLFSTIFDMIDGAWSFRYKQLDSLFLSAYTLCLPVMTVFTRQTAIMVNAEHASGKSRFVSGLIGGTGFPSINIVASALAMQGYTAASIRQQRNNSSLTLCLEEFEDYGGMDAKSVAVRKVLELCRDLISEGAVNWSIGTTSGESRTYHLKFPLVCCAIRPLRDAASLSRFIGFELVKDSTRQDPVYVLETKYGKEGIANIRHQVAVGMLPHMPRLRFLQKEIEREFTKEKILPAHASSRFAEALYPVLAMMKFMKELAPDNAKIPDYKKFAVAFSQSRKESLERLKTTSENEQIFESILSSPIQIANDTGESGGRMSWATTVRVMLGDINNLNVINKTKKGVYYDAKKEWLIVSWLEACQGVLMNTRYRQDTPGYLKSISERSPHYVATKEAKQERTLERLVEVMGPGQSYDLVTVFSVRHLMDSTRDALAQAKASADGGSVPPRTEADEGTTEDADGTGDTETIDDITV